MVVTLHDLIPATYYSLSELPIRQRLFYQWNLRRVLSADALVTVSFSSQEDICGYAGLAPERVRVIPNAVDFVAEPDPGPLARLGVKKPYVLYAGSYEPRKNLAQALLVFASLIARGYPHDLVALVERDSGHAKGVLSELAKLGLGARVHLVHSLPDDDVRRLYTHAEVLFFPTLAEGFGYPVLQAALVGLPVAASDLPVLREVAGDAALFFDPREVDDMLSALARLLGSVQLREQLAIKGRRRAGYFRVDAWVESHIDVYERLSRIPVAA